MILFAGLLFLALTVGIALRNGTPIGILTACIAGQLLLPRDAVWNSTDGEWYFGKRTFIAIAIILAIGTNYRTIRQGKLNWFDLAPTLFLLSPLFSVLANRGENWTNGIAIVVDRILVWGVPYIAGRICFQTRHELELVRKWLLYGTLMISPLFAWEAFLGPDYYLSKLIFGTVPYENMTWRLGGWRPELFFFSGIECGTWIACCTAIAISAVKIDNWYSVENLTSVAVCIAMLVLLVFSRTIYAYALLIGTLPFCLLAFWIRRPYPLLVLVIGVSVYCATRSTGSWDGELMVQVVAKSKNDKVGSIAYRVRAENSYVEKVCKHGPIWGFGGTNSAIYDWWAKNHLWPDGWWVHIFRCGGYAGLATWIGFFGLMPLLATMPFSIPPRWRSVEPSGKLIAFSCFVILNLVDGLHNMAILGTTGLLLGAIVATRAAAVSKLTKQATMEQSAD